MKENIEDGKDHDKFWEHVKYIPDFSPYYFNAITVLVRNEEAPETLFQKAGYYCKKCDSKMNEDRTHEDCVIVSCPQGCTAEMKPLRITAISCIGGTG